MDAADLRREPWDVGAEKLADPALDVRARGALCLWALQSAQWARPALVAELCTPDAARSAERSCAAQAVAAVLQEQPDAGGQLELEGRPMQRSKAKTAQ
jgi:hypothetical protein